MPWGRLDDQLHDNEKVESLTHQEFRLWILSISRCNRKRKEEPEGRVSQAMAETLCRQVGASTRRQIAALIAGMLKVRPPRDTSFWEPHAEGGYVIHDFPEYANKADQTAAERKRAERERKRLAERDGTRDGAASHAPVTRDSGCDTDRDAHVRAGGPFPVPRNPDPGTPDGTAEVDGALSADHRRPSARDRTVAFAVPKPGETPAAKAEHDAVVAWLTGEFHGDSPPNKAERDRLDQAAGLFRESRVGLDELPALFETARERWEADGIEVTPIGVARNVSLLRKPRPATTNGRAPRGPSKFAANVADLRALHQEAQP